MPAPPGGGGAHPVTAPGFHPPDAKYRRLPSLLSRRFPHPMPLTFQTLNQPDTVDFPSAAPLFRPAPAPAQRAVTPQPGPAGHAIDLSNPEGCQTVAGGRAQRHPRISCGTNRTPAGVPELPNPAINPHTSFFHEPSPTKRMGVFKSMAGAQRAGGGPPPRPAARKAAITTVTV